MTRKLTILTVFTITMLMAFVANSISSLNLNSEMPDVFDDIVVWADHRTCPDELQNNVEMDACSEIFGYNLVTKKEMRITNWQGAKKDFVRIWGDRIFVLASDNGWFYYTIDVPEELKTP